MKKNLFWGYFLILIGLFGATRLIGYTREVEELAVYYKKEVINGRVFVYREDVANGVKKEICTVDGAPVAFSEYEEAILEAEKEVRRHERQAELERRSALQKERLATSLQLHKKLLRLEIDRVEAALNRLDDHRIISFLVFDDATFSKEDFEGLSDGLLKNAKGLLWRVDEEQDLASLNTMISSLDGLSDRLDELFQVTVNNAIKLCDDTRVLKELLSLLSS